VKSKHPNFCSDTVLSDEAVNINTFKEKDRKVMDKNDNRPRRRPPVAEIHDSE